MEITLWEKQAFISATDILIIGGGMIGLQSAIALKKLAPQLQIVILEQYPFPRGASMRNAGFACIGSMTELLADEKKYDWETVKVLLTRRWLGLQALLNLLGESAIDYRQVGGYEIFFESEVKKYEQCVMHMGRVNEYLASLTGEKDTFSAYPYDPPRWGFSEVKYVIQNQVEGQLHPGKMMKQLLHLAQEIGIQYVGGITVDSWKESDEEVWVYTKDRLTWSCKRLLIATNGFTRRILPSLPVLPARNQVLLTNPLRELEWEGTFHYHQGYIYFRTVNNRLLIGGARHLDMEGEKTDIHASNQDIVEYLKAFARQYLLPHSEVNWDYHWTGILGVGDKQPLQQWISPKVYTAVGMGGMGIAIGTTIGQETAQALKASLEGQF